MEETDFTPVNEEMTPETGKGKEVNSSLNWLERILGLETHYGFGRMFMGVLLIFVTAVVGFAVMNPESLVEHLEKAQQQSHNKALMKRLEADPIIRTDLIELRNALAADRTFVMETHNGGSNLNGLPFLFVDMTYDEPLSGYMKLETDYKNFRLSRYPFADVVYREQYWAGQIDAIKDVDEELYARLKNDGTGYLALIVMYGEQNPSGVLGVVYSSSNLTSVDPGNIHREILKYSTKIGAILCYDPSEK